MPPPRLPRHLRPCHPPWNTHQVRCAPTTSRLKSSIARGDVAQGAASSLKPTPGWWESVINRIAPLGPSAGSKETDTQPSPLRALPIAPSATTVPSPPPPAPSLLAETALESREGTQADGEAPLYNISESHCNPSPSISKHTAHRAPARLKSPPRTTSRSVLPHLPPLPKQALRSNEEADAGGEDAPATNVEFNRAKASNRTSRLANQPAPALRQNSQLPRAEAFANTSHSLSDHSARRHAYDEESVSTAGLSNPTHRGALPVENLTWPSVERLVPPSNQSTRRSQGQEHATIQLKLHGLLKQVKLLQDKLDQKPSSPMASQQTAAHLAASLTGSELLKPDGSAGGAEHIDARTRPSSNSQRRWWKYSARLPARSTPAEHAISAALNRYRASVWHVEKILLELQDFSTPRVQPIVRMIRGRLFDIASDPFLEDDRQMTAILKNYKDASTLSITSSVASMSTDLLGNARLGVAPVRDESSNRARRAEAVSNQLQQGIDDQQLIRYTHAPLRSTIATNSFESVLHTSSRTGFETPSLPESEANTPSIPVSNAKVSFKRISDLQAKPTPSQMREVSKQSLLEELFPEASGHVQPHDQDGRTQYPKLDLPDSIPLVRREFVDRPRNLKEQVVASFQRSGEQITALQLSHCSTQLTESDFRQLIPRGKHIDSWVRIGDFFKIIPGRDPLSLERLPFYYLLFKTPESALAYQKNVSRLHKLSALHGPSNIFSAIPPPKGFLEDGEDLATATSSYLLVPATHELRLHTVMQPYNPALRGIIEQGGYRPIVPNVEANGKRIYKVLVHIEGYEPSQWDLWQIFMRHAQEHGIIWPFHPESPAGIHRLREVVNLKTRLLPVSSANPRAASQSLQYSRVEYDDPSINSLMVNPDDENSSKETNQMVMNRVYNRWIVNFTEEDAARRFAVMWHSRR